MNHVTVLHHTQAMPFLFIKNMPQGAKHNKITGLKDGYENVVMSQVVGHGQSCYCITHSNYESSSRRTEHIQRGDMCLAHTWSALATLTNTPK